MSTKDKANSKYSAAWLSASLGGNCMQSISERFYSCVSKEYPKCNVQKELFVLKKMYNDGMCLILEFTIRLKDENISPGSEKQIEELNILAETTIKKYFPEISTKSKKYLSIQKILFDSFRFSADMYSLLEPLLNAKKLND